jgi:hypothetical protein
MKNDIDSLPNTPELLIKFFLKISFRAPKNNLNGSDVIAAKFGGGGRKGQRAIMYYRVDCKRSFSQYLVECVIKK